MKNCRSNMLHPVPELGSSEHTDTRDRHSGRVSGNIRLRIVIGAWCLMALSFVLSLHGSAYGAEITLAWNAVNDVAGYRIYYGTKTNTYTWVVDVGNKTSHTLTNLSASNTYFLAATAYDSSDNESDFSNEVSYGGTSCTYSISPQSASLATSGGSGTISVTTQSGCTWTASSGVSWLTFSTSSGTGSGNVTYSVTANQGTSRSATATLAGQSFTILQSGTQTKYFTLTASAGTGGSISPTGNMSVSAGASRTFVITPKSGYKIYTVTVDGKSVGAVSSYTFSNITAAHTITATFVPKVVTLALKTYAISSKAETGGYISPSGNISISYGASMTFVITPKSGYRIYRVIIDGKSVGAVSSYTFSNITAAHTITARFVKK